MLKVPAGRYSSRWRAPASTTGAASIDGPSMTCDAQDLHFGCLTGARRCWKLHSHRMGFGPTQHAGTLEAEQALMRQAKLGIE